MPNVCQNMTTLYRIRYPLITLSQTLFFYTFHIYFYSFFYFLRMVIYLSRRTAERCGKLAAHRQHWSYSIRGKHVGHSSPSPWSEASGEFIITY